MKAKPFQLSALNIEQQYMGVLLFGSDIARIQDLAIQIKNQILTENDPFALITLTPNQLKNNPYYITDEANTPSFMQTRRLIWVKEGHTLSVDALIHFSQNCHTNTFLLITADNLPKNNALRLEAEALPNFLAIACYPPEAPELCKIITDFAHQNHFTMAPNAIDFLIQNTENNTLLLKNELDKIALYNQNKKTITLEIIQDLIGLGNAKTDQLIQAIATKNTSLSLSLLILLLNQGEQAVSLIRQISRYFDLLLQGKGLSQQGKNPFQITDILLKPAQFRLKQPFQDQLRIWSLPQLIYVKHQLTEAEIQLKSAPLTPELICQKLIFNLTVSNSLK